MAKLPDRSRHEEEIANQLYNQFDWDPPSKKSGDKNYPYLDPDKKPRQRTRLVGVLSSMLNMLRVHRKDRHK